MTRRVQRLTPWPRIPAQIRQSIGGSQHKALGAPVPLRRPGTIPVQAYGQTRRTPLTGGYGAVLVAADGTATVSVGPQGLGTVWYPQSAAIATTLGAADTSTCTLYLGPLGLETQIGGQSYAGGGDSIGVAVPPLWPGYFLWAVWAGATAGNLASLAVYGEMDSLAL